MNAKLVAIVVAVGAIMLLSVLSANAQTDPCDRDSNNALNNVQNCVYEHDGQIYNLEQDLTNLEDIVEDIEENLGRKSASGHTHDPSLHEHDTDHEHDLAHDHDTSHDHDHDHDEKSSVTIYQTDLSESIALGSLATTLTPGKRFGLAVGVGHDIETSVALGILMRVDNSTLSLGVAENSASASLLMEW